MSTSKSRPPRPDWWLYTVALLLAIQISLYVVPHVQPGLLGMVCWLIGGDQLLWLGLGAIFLLVAGWTKRTDCRAGGRAIRRRN